MVTLCEEWGEARAAILKMDPTQKAFLEQVRNSILKAGWTVLQSSEPAPFEKPKSNKWAEEARVERPKEEHTWIDCELRPLAFQFWQKAWQDLERKLDRWIILGFVRRGPIKKWDGKIGEVVFADD